MKERIKSKLSCNMLARIRRARRRAETLYYWGTTVQCPICEGRFRRFVYHLGRRNARCPKCDALERHRMIWLHLRENSNLFNSRCRLLHFAPERFFRDRLKHQANVDHVGIDLASSEADVISDILNIPMADGCFDGVLCVHVLEHIEDDRRAMSELWRVLKPGGWALVGVPIAGDTTFEDPSVRSPEERRRLFGQEDHVRRYGTDIALRLRKAGFEVEQVECGHLDEGTRAFYGLASNIFYWCSK